MGQRGLIKAPKLFEYGITVEKSDIRAHVSVVNETLYVFPTRCGIQAIRENNIPLKPAFQRGVNGATADGWPVCIELIPNLRPVHWPDWEGWAFANPKWLPSMKGKFAVRCVLDAMKRGLFPFFWIDGRESQGNTVQQQGTDILVVCHHRIQVKCDWFGGAAPLGTGNLYLQRAECNPLKTY